MKVDIMRVERRQFGRRTTALHAWIRIAGRPQIACMVRNLSDSGALLEFDVPDWLPFRFRLAIEATGLECDCETRHNGTNGIGVSFIAAKDRRASEARPLLTDKDVWGGPARR
jgi:hypothetical protein